MKNPYTSFLIMLVLSFIGMYCTMYLNTYEASHAYFSLTRFYMACLGISVMALIMFGIMRGMYKNAKKNTAIIVVSIFLFTSSLYLVRAQKPIGDTLWIKAMIPHHSIAILTSKRADIKDPEVKKLAKSIIEAQEKEILEMKAMLKRLENQDSE